jgi:hypothetical protein
MTRSSMLSLSGPGDVIAGGTSGRRGDAGGDIPLRAVVRSPVCVGSDLFWDGGARPKSGIGSGGLMISCGEAVGVKAPFLFSAPPASPLTLFVSIGSGDDVLGRGGRGVTDAGG